jgi:hypothetical protein
MMLSLSCWLVSAAALAGVVVALLDLRATSPAQRPPRAACVAHGLVGTAGLALLLLALRGRPRGALAGASSFGLQAAVLLSAALLAGIAIAILGRLRSRTARNAIFVHALLAITGYVMLIAYASQD